jgi:hypothetical protein
VSKGGRVRDQTKRVAAAFSQCVTANSVFSRPDDPTCAPLLYWVAVTGYWEEIVANPRSLEVELRQERRASMTNPIWMRTEDGAIQGVGTALFFAHRGQKFVITAAHVLRDHNKHQLFVAIGQVEVSLNGRWFRLPDEEMHDVAFVPVGQALPENPTDVTFVTRDLVDLDEDPTPHLHYVVGYVADDHQYGESVEELTASCSIYGMRSAPLDLYEPRRLTPAEHLLLSFNHRVLWDLDGLVDPEPPPEGLSGAAVWRVGKDRWSDRLVAILGAYSEYGKVVYATRMSLLMRALDEFVEGTVPPCVSASTAATPSSSLDFHDTTGRSSKR